MLRKLLTGVALTLSPFTPNPAQQRPAQPRDDEQRRPNVVFLIADDLTAEALSCHGNRQFMTPSIDRLAGLAVPEHVAGRSLLRVLAGPDARVSDAGRSINARGQLLRTERWVRRPEGPGW